MQPATGAYRRRQRLARQRPRFDPFAYDLAHRDEQYCIAIVFYLLAFTFFIGSIVVSNVHPSLTHMQSTPILNSIVDGLHTFIYGTVLWEKQPFKKMSKTNPPALPKKEEEIKEPHQYQASYDRFRRLAEEHHAKKMRAEAEARGSTTVIDHTNDAVDGAERVATATTSVSGDERSTLEQGDGRGAATTAPTEPSSNVDMDTSHLPATVASTEELASEKTTSEMKEEEPASAETSTTDMDEPTETKSDDSVGTSDPAKDLGGEGAGSGTASSSSWTTTSSTQTSSSSANAESSTTKTTTATTTLSPTATTTTMRLPLIGILTLDKVRIVEVPFAGVAGVNYTSRDGGIVHATVYPHCRMFIKMFRAGLLPKSHTLDNLSGSTDMYSDVVMTDFTGFDVVSGFCSN